MDYTTTVTTIAALAFTATAIKRLIYPEPDLKYDSDSDSKSESDSESDLDSDSDLEFEYVSSGPLSDKILEDLEWLNQNHPNWREPPTSSIKFN